MVPYDASESRSVMCIRVSRTTKRSCYPPPCQLKVLTSHLHHPTVSTFTNLGRHFTAPAPPATSFTISTPPSVDSLLTLATMHLNASTKTSLRPDHRLLDQDDWRGYYLPVNGYIPSTFPARGLPSDRVTEWPWPTNAKSGGLGGTIRLIPR